MSKRVYWQLLEQNNTLIQGKVLLRKKQPRYVRTTIELKHLEHQHKPSNFLKPKLAMPNY